MSKFVLNISRSSILATRVARMNIIATFHSSAPRQEVFKIQTEDEFKEKVLNNKKLVVLDFFATYVYLLIF